MGNRRSTENIGVIVEETLTDRIIRFDRFRLQFTASLEVVGFL